MRVRKNITPRRPNDIFCFLLLVIALPAVFMFELLVVLPEMHQPNSFMYWLTMIVAFCILHNVVGNFLLCIIVDTSVNFNQLKEPPFVETKGWRYCIKCHKWAPPRTWHCEVCRCCILKRDHHCVFTGCCVGQNNHRYFMMFLIYMAIATTYALVYNTVYFFVLKSHIYVNWLTPVKLICPILLFAIGNSLHNIYLMAYTFNFLGWLYSIVLLIYHAPIILQGGTSFERGKDLHYNMGWRKNLQCVFGKRLIYVLFSPFVISELPFDGINWPEIVINRVLLEQRNKQS